MENLRKQGRLPQSSASSSGVFEVEESRAPHSSTKPRPPNAQPPELFRRDGEECKKEEMVPASDAKGTIYCDIDDVETGTSTVEPRAVNQGQELRRNLTRKGRLPATYDSSPGASAIQDPRAPYGFGRPRPQATLSPQEPCKQDVGECKKEVKGQAIDTERNVNNNSHVVESKPGPVEEAHAVHDQEARKARGL